MVLPYTPEHMSYAFEAAWTLLKQEQEDEANPVTHMGRRGRARAERREQRDMSRRFYGQNSPLMNETVAARREGRRTPLEGSFIMGPLPHIRGQAHPLDALPFREDHPDVKVHDRTMGRMRMPTTGPVTVPGQAEDMSPPGPMSDDEFEGLMLHHSLLKPQPSPFETRRMQLGDFPVRQR